MAERTFKLVFSGDASGAKTAMGQIEEGGNKLSRTFGDMTKVAGGFVLGQGILQAPGFLMNAADNAKDLALQAQKAATVFGEELPAVQQWAAANAHSMGLTKSEATNLAAGLADLLVPMGMTRDQAAEMATKTIGLSGALSEWSGGARSAAEVSTILQKAYLGETDGLKELGIAISAEDVKARLAAKGQQELTGAAQQQAEALAIQEMVFEKSTDAQKAYAEGAGDAARKQAEANAKWKETQETISNGLLPVMTTLTTVMADQIVPAIQAVVNVAGPAFQAAFGFIAEHKEEILIALAAVAAGITGVMLPAIAAWIVAEAAKAAALLVSAAAFVAANAPMIAIGAAIALLIAGIILLVQNWDTITAKVPFLGTVVDGVKAGLEAFANWITGTFLPALQKIADKVAEVVTAAVNFVRDHWDEIRAVIEPALEALKAIVQSYWDQIKVIFETVIGVIKGIVDVFMGVFTGDWDRAWNGVKQIVDSIWDGIKGTIENAIGLIKDLAPLILDAGSALGSALLDGLKSALSAVGGFATDVGQAVLNAVKSVVNTYVIGKINSALEFTIPVPGPIPDIHLNPPDIPYLAAGVRGFGGGLAVVGERGPELVVLPRGADVYSSREMRGMAAAGAGPSVSINGPITINAATPAQGRQAAGDFAYALQARLRARGYA
jgi:phage-related protein